MEGHKRNTTYTYFASKEFLNITTRFHLNEIEERNLIQNHVISAREFLT